MDVTVVIPCYNEETNIRNGVLHVVKEYLDRQSYTKEVIIVDDGSDDASVKLTEEFIQNNNATYFRIIKNAHGGKAATVITGLLAGSGEVVLFTDMDQATPLSESEKLLPFFEQGYHIVFGSRAGERKGAPLSRKVLSTGHMILKNLILQMNVKDTQCGFKAFRKEVIKPILNRMKIHNRTQKVKGSMVASGFDIELLFIAQKAGYKLKEVPVEWHYVGTKRVDVIKDSYRGLRDMVILRMNDLRGVYNEV